MSLFARCLVLWGVVLVGCALPTFSPTTTPAEEMTREQAMQRASGDAKLSAPEFGLVEARIDKVDAEMILRTEAEQRFGGFAPGIDANQKVWWVTVKGKFVYESMPTPDGRPFYETDNRVFVYDRATGALIMSGGLGASKFLGATPFPPTATVTR